MINFNLLPPEIKEELKWEKINRSFALYSIIIVVMIVIFILMLSVIQLYSVIELAKLENTVDMRKENVEIQKKENLEKEIESFNKYLTNLEKVQKNHLYFSQVISIFAESVPKSVQIVQLDIIQPEEDQKNNTTQPKKTSSSSVSSPEKTEKKFQINIKGNAAKRDDLLFFKNTLEKTSCFAKIYSPLSNLVEREDIDFRFTGDLNKEFLFKKSGDNL